MYHLVVSVVLQITIWTLSSQIKNPFDMAAIDLTTFWWPVCGPITQNQSICLIQLLTIFHVNKNLKVLYLCQQNCSEEV